jgi:CheY-like chemotaxis protein
MALVNVVDDDDDLRILMTLRLRGAGHDVVAAADGELGLEIVLGTDPDLVIVDWMMPKMNGIEMCRAIRSTPGFDRTPILMVTSRISVADRNVAIAAGVTQVITKPNSLSDLVHLVDDLVEASDSPTGLCQC